MGKLILAILIGIPIAFVLAFSIVALVNTGEINPVVSQPQYFALRGEAFLLFFALSGIIGWIAAKSSEWP